MAKEKILEFLGEYGITTLDELNKALAKLPLIDLTPFTGNVINKSTKDTGRRRTNV